MFFFKSNFKECDLCKSKNFKILLEHKGDGMTSDQRISFSKILKIECKKCGLVRNKNIEREINYKKKYTYNTSKQKDVQFFNNKGSQDRSSQVFDWISSLINKKQFLKIHTIMEVGCGEGNLLLKFQKEYPKKKIIGLEINEKAILKGKSKGLDIRSLKDPILEKADLVISYAVIEHTTSPTNFLKSISKILNPNGLVLIGTPHQDRISHDIFFIDHLFHFSSKHIQDIARIVNLKLLSKSTKKWPIDSFGIYLFQLSKTKMKPIIKNRKNKCKDSIKFYLNSFKKINLELKKIKKNEKIAVLGLGEFFSLLNTYTKLNYQKISYGLDDFPKSKKFSFPIIPINKAKLLKIDTVFVCTNPNYYDIILNKIKDKKIKIFLPFQRMIKK